MGPFLLFNVEAPFIFQGNKWKFFFVPDRIVCGMQTVHIAEDQNCQPSVQFSLKASQGQVISFPTLIKSQKQGNFSIVAILL